MITLLQAISAFFLSMLFREAPSIEKDPARHREFTENVTTMVAVHAKTAEDGLLVDPQYDALLLSVVNYRESRMRLPAPEGDCRIGHDLDSVPRLSWPAGYKPKTRRICNAVGPMQVYRGFHLVAGNWPETQFSLPGRDLKVEPLTAEELAKPDVSSKIAYGILVHWKRTCAALPAGVWLTAYQLGHCPSRVRSKYYITKEAVRRCRLTNTAASDLAIDDSTVYNGLSAVPCTYADMPVVENKQ